MARSSPHRAVLSFEYPTPAAARLVERSVRVEVADLADDRSAAAVDRDGATLAVTVRAEDLVALRAAVNTWTHLVGAAERVGGVASEN